MNLEATVPIRLTTLSTPVKRFCYRRWLPNFFKSGFRDPLAFLLRAGKAAFYGKNRVFQPVVFL